METGRSFLGIAQYLNSFLSCQDYRFLTDFTPRRKNIMGIKQINPNTKTIATSSRGKGSEEMKGWTTKTKIKPKNNILA